MTAVVLLASPSVSPVWSVLLVIPFLILFAPQPMHATWRRIASCAAVLLVWGVALYAASIVVPCTLLCCQYPQGSWEWWLFGCGFM
jgi:hypothetical protein